MQQNNKLMPFLGNNTGILQVDTSWFLTFHHLESLEHKSKHLLPKPPCCNSIMTDLVGCSHMLRIYE
jgi:hypothetical protein